MVLAYLTSEKYKNLVKRPNCLINWKFDLIRAKTEKD